MEWLFGHKKTPEEILKEHQRSLRRVIRELDRERSKLEQQEKRVVIDIKSSAKAGQMAAAKIQAKDLVRTRGHIKKMILMKTQVQAVSLKIQTLKSTNTMAQAMKGVTKAMSRMNKQINLPGLQKIMMEFERQNEIMDIKSEMMEDSMDDIFAEDDEEEETEMVVQQVLDELGLSLAGDLVNTPTTGATVATPAAQQAQPVADGADADLQARLDQLRRD
eukprot:m.271043 g.271043  ORF g.271043 m.271043 type:complete len:219 (-) comp19318_c1_seq1:132-788(-)